MPVPTYSLFCQTTIYPTSCWHCQQDIHVLQCSCGSAVLFDDIGPPWPKHGCVGTGGARGIGGSGLSGWEVVDALRSQGVPISKNIVKMIFPADPLDDSRTHLANEIERMDPMISQNWNVLAVVRELHLETGTTSTVNGLPAIGMIFLGLDPRVSYWQITLVKNDVRPNDITQDSFPNISHKI